MRFGREIQIPTIQLDFATPKRFGLFYIDEKGEKQVPVMIHRAILGSYERFLVLLLEQLKGVLPIWLSPVQVNIIPVNVKAHIEYCKQLEERLLKNDIRVKVDDSDESLNKKIKISNEMKNPYTVVIGDKEISDNIVCYRKLGSNEQVSVGIDEFVDMINTQIREDMKI